MRKCLILLLLLSMVVLPVGAVSLELPQTPESATPYLHSEDTGLLEGITEIGRNAISALAPKLREAMATCLGIMVAVILCGLFKTTLSDHGLDASGLLGVAVISLLLLKSTDTFIRLGQETVAEISSYSQQLLPVVSTALVASGGTTKAVALYLGTAFADSLLSRVISQVVCPMVYLFAAVSIGKALTGNSLLARMGDMLKSWITWGLKLVLYCFTGYMTITGVVSGSTDAIALRAAKLTISGAVPVVGGIISDASEAILVGAGAVRSTVGIGGLLVVLAITAAPFLQVGAQYLLLKLTSAWCSVLGTARHSALVESFAQAMGLVLAMVGTCSLLQLISIICFMKGVG